MSLRVNNLFTLPLEWIAYRSETYKKIGIKQRDEMGKLGLLCVSVNFNGIIRVRAKGPLCLPSL